MLAKNLEHVLNEAFREAQMRDHMYLTVEHLLFAILENEEGKTIIELVGGDPEEILKDVDEYLNLVEKNYNSDEGPVQTVTFQKLLQKAIVHVHNAEKREVEIGDILVAILDEEELEATYFLKKGGLEKVQLLEFISHGDHEHGPQSGTEQGGDAQREDKSDHVQRYALDMTELARAGKYDQLIGRDTELQRTIEILCRRTKNNPVFVGDPGVGKTAIVQGLAQQIVNNQVPERLNNYKVFSLDLGALVAGTKYRGDFEKRLKGFLSDVKKYPHAVIFIDEIHTLVGAGSVGGGSLDASNLLKPMLASGELQCIGATTHEEFRQYIEKDKALSRRFQKIDVPEPSTEDTYRILEGLRDRYEAFHGVRYTKTALKASVDLAVRYLKDRFLPDKAIDLLDEAGASASIYKKAEKVVTKSDIEKLVARVARIPKIQNSHDDTEKLKGLAESLKAEIFGQDDAIEKLVSIVKKQRAGLAPPDRPAGVFLFIGPTGVGKTALSKSLAESLGVELVRFDMSEFAEKHSVSRLLGSPPGYVGFDQGAALTDTIRKKPHSVLLLDEIEKAHPDIFNLMLQVFDGGVITDNTGKSADFTHVYVVMTSNVGSRDMETLKIGFGGEQREYGDPKKELKSLFPPEFLNRIDHTIIFNHLDAVVIRKVIMKELSLLKDTLRRKKVELSFKDEIIDHIAALTLQKQSGARDLKRELDQKIIAPVVDQILFGDLQKGGKVELTEKDGEIGFLVTSRY